MKTSSIYCTAYAMLATGLVHAHEGSELIAHAHPHLGTEHVILGLAAAVVATGYAVWRRGS